jgi:hypothetical protein
MPETGEQYQGMHDINEPRWNQEKVTASKATDANGTGIDSADYKLAMRLYSDGKKARKFWDGDWDRQLKWYQGEQWDWRRPSYKASPSLNILRSNIQTMLPILTDTSPSFDFIPQEVTDNDFADLSNKLLENWWSRSNMQVKLTYCLLDMLVFDACGVMKIVWNPDLDGIGDIECTRVDPRNIYVDPDAMDFPDAKFVIEEKWVPASELRMKFPAKAQYIKGGRYQTDPKKTYEGKTLSGQVTLQSPNDQDIPLNSQGEQDKNTSGAGTEMKSLKVLEVWVKDDTLEEIDLTNDDGSITQGLKKKYPRGKLITIIPDNGILLQSLDNPYGDGEFPYVKFIDTVRPGAFWGEGEIGPLIETQKLINKVGATITDWCNRMANPVWILDDDSGVDPNRLTNQVGLIITKKRGTEVRREAPPPMPSELFQFYTLLMKLAETQSGIHDVTQGRKPQGITAGVAIDAMQDAAQTRIRLKERNMQASLIQLGRKWLSRALQFYETPRTVRITGMQGWPEIYEVFFTKNENDQYILNHKSYQFAPGTRKFEPVSDWQSTEPSKGEFDLECNAGTSLPFMKERKGQLAFQLYQAKAIDQEALLTAVEWPNWQETQRRMQEKAQAESQAQAGAPAPGAPVPPPVMGGQ